MSWFTHALQSVLPIIARVASNTNVQKAGEDLFAGIADKIKENLRNPTKLAELADTIHAKAPELTGAIVANTPAAAEVSPDIMPPGSVPQAGTAGAAGQPQGQGR